MFSAKCLSELKGETVIIMGDCPLIKRATIEKLIAVNQNYDMTVVTTHVNTPNTYGKIIRDDLGNISKITEHYNLLSQQGNINEINTGVYCIKNTVLFKFLPYISNENVKGEYCFTDIVNLLYKNGKKVHTLVAPDNTEFMGVNTLWDLHLAQETLSKQINQSHMQNGVQIINPHNTYIGPDVKINSGAVIYPNTHIYGNTTIGQDTVVYPNCWKEHATIGKDCMLNNSKITNSVVGDFSCVGPYAHIRNNATIQESVRIGNFVEVKNSTLCNKAKTAHLSYIGDSLIGENVNVGCGVVTVNYDGQTKHKTYIGKNSFIGCNVNLIAPVSVGDNCVVAAGSTITYDVPDGNMAIARAYQVNKEGRGETYLKNKKYI